MNAIDIRGLTKMYGDAVGIEELTLAVPEGSIFGFIGPNGAGKSTTIRTLLGLIHPSAGAAAVLGRDIRREQKAIRKRIGFMPSEVQYYLGMSVQSLLEYSARFYGAVDKARIADYASRFNLALNRPIGDLSLGNKKKVTIVQALIHEPELLILDEPTSGLDPLMQARFFETLREHHERGATIFFSSHTLREVEQFCEHVAIIKDGRIIETNRVRELRGTEMKRVRVELAGVDAAPDVQLAGIVAPEFERHEWRFLFNGSINELLRTLASLPVTSIEIQEPELEEIFMHYYTEGATA